MIRGKMRIGRAIAGYEILKMMDNVPEEDKAGAIADAFETVIEELDDDLGPLSQGTIDTMRGTFLNALERHGASDA